MMKTKFMVEGSTVSVVNLNDELALDKLPPKVYTVQFNKMFGFYLNILKDQLQVPNKIYGNVMQRANKCIKTYCDRTASTGILMTGDKGTGKTLLMSLLANKVIAELELPVILVTEPHAGEQFTAFLGAIGECCLIFDEFGKMYDKRGQELETPSQESLLSLLDGVDKTKRLIIMTENNEYDINEFLLSRPSRVYYHFRYRKMDEDSIEGYCADRQVGDDVVGEIIDLSRRTKIFSFDMLQSIVEEHLRFGSSVNDLVVDLNVDTRAASIATIEIIKVVSKATGREVDVVGSKIVEKPTSQYSYTYLSVKEAASRGRGRPVGEITEATEDDNNDRVHFDSTHLEYEVAGNLVYETSEYTIVAKEMPKVSANYFDLF